MTEGDGTRVVIHESIRTRTNKCSNCGKKLDACTGIGRQVPKEGDYSVCAYCGSVARWTRDLRLIPLTDEEVASFLEELQRSDPQTSKILDLTREYFKEAN
jgi:DNA-directed RNA polymerase subunit RPC12/RpoP